MGKSKEVFQEHKEAKPALEVLCASENSESGLNELRRKAGEAHDPSAQFDLGVCYADGIGVEKNLREAVKWYRAAAGQSHAQAQLKLGLCHMLGTGTGKDKVKAMFWIQKAADQGVAEAEYIIGCSYELGFGVIKNETEAIKWYQRAAEQGFEKAENKLKFG